MPIFGYPRTKTVCYQIINSIESSLVRQTQKSPKDKIEKPKSYFFQLQVSPQFSLVVALDGIILPLILSPGYYGNAKGRTYLTISGDFEKLYGSETQTISTEHFCET